MKRLLAILLFIFLFAINANSAGLMAVTSPTATGSDTTPPTLSTVTIGTNGTSWTYVYNETVVGDPTSDLCDAYAVTMSTQGAITQTYASGSGSNTVVCTGDKTVNSGETVTAGLDYTQPGDGIEDAAGNDLASIDDKAVTNNSTQGSCTYETSVELESYWDYNTTATFTTTFWRAQSFQHDANCTIVAINVFLLDGGNSISVTLRIETDNANKPSGNLVHANATKTESSISDAGADLEFIFANTFDLVADTKYWIVFKSSGEGAAVADQVGSGAYANGVFAYTSDSGTNWTLESSNDMYFQIYGCE